MKKLVAATLALALMAGWAQAQGNLTSTGEPVAAVDNIPPAPVEGIRAFDTPNAVGESITLAWELSIDDALYTAPFQEGFVTRSGLDGYRIYRQVDAEGEALLLGEVRPGTGEYIDTSVEVGTTYIYSVRPFDQDNETLPLIEAGSEADLARIVRVGFATQPVDANGEPILGWFARTSDTVGFDDFFLFADHFGLGEGEEGYDPLFDIVVNMAIDFDDFFRFADDFGKVVNNVGDFGL